MPADIINYNNGMMQLAGQTVNKFGLDQTGQINYTFNKQGFRNNQDYNFVPEYAFFGCSLVFGIGVDINNVSASLFKNSQNYGLAGQYTNEDIYNTCMNFVNSKLYNDSTAKIVVWANRNENLDSYYKKLQPYNFMNFFCDNTLLYNNCWPMIKTIDHDVSLTHMGIKSNVIFYKILCQLLKK